MGDIERGERAVKAFDLMISQKKIDDDTLKNFAGKTAIERAKLEIQLIAAKAQIKAANHDPECDYWRWDWKYSWHISDCTCDKESKLMAAVELQEQEVGDEM